MKHFAGVVLIRLIVLSCLAQDIAVGTWRTHYSYVEANHVVATGDKLFVAAANGLYSYSVADGSVRLLSKIDGLSDVGVSRMAYHEPSNTLVIGYRSGYVDFISDDGIVSFDLIHDANQTNDKTIASITFSDDRTFIGSGFGITVVRTATVDVVDNYAQIGAGGANLSVLDMVLTNERLYARTTEGIQVGSVASNLLDFNNWSRILGDFAFMAQNEDEVLVTRGDSLYAYNDANQLVYKGFDQLQPLASSNALFSVAADTLWQYVDGAFTYLRELPTNTEVNGVEVVASQLYIATSEGVLKEDESLIVPPGPGYDTFSRLKVVDGNLFGFHAPNPVNGVGDTREPYYSSFTLGQWQRQQIDNFYNISDVAVLDEGRYFASIGFGLYDENENEMVRNIPGSNALEDTVITSITTYGDQLWLTSYNNNQPVHVFDGSTWNSFESEFVEKTLLSSQASSMGALWFQGASGAITFYNTEGEAMILNAGDGVPGFFNDLEISVDDNVWMTGVGVSFFSNGSFIGENEVAIAPVLEGRVLFEGEDVLSIETDGGNRVWMGTTRGLWLFDENISTEVALFNESNSPLTSDVILDLEYDGTSGELFILTPDGLLSYRTASSIGRPRHRNVAIFPSPVRPEYTGMVGISGLANNVSVKITDSVGNLVQEVVANGGTASWNLKTMEGTDVVTGIYYFFSATFDGTETYVGKLAVVR